MYIKTITKIEIYRKFDKLKHILFMYPRLTSEKQRHFQPNNYISDSISFLANKK